MTLNIQTVADTINILQLSDLHLSSTLPQVDADQPVTPKYCQRKFEHCLADALSQDIRCDFILVTGDLVSKIDGTTYDAIFAILDGTGIPYACLPGNHDVTDEIGEMLPFTERTLVAHAPDKRLLSRYCIDIKAADDNHWRLLLLNSGVPGAVHGELSLTELDCLDNQLAHTPYPTLIAMHHHALPVHSKWLDNHLLSNAEAFWRSASATPHVKAVITGHVHQQFDSHYEGRHGAIAMLTTPSTCYQFKPSEHEFAIDKTASSGYRWLQLHQNAHIKSWVERI